MTEPQFTTQKKILVVEDHPLFRTMLVQLINMEIDMIVCGEANNTSDAKILINTIHPDLMILDLTLKESSGLGLIKHMNTLSAKVPVLVISMHDEAVYSERTLRAGARGYISKQADTSEVIKAIRKVLAGSIYLSDEASDNILEGVGKTANSSSIPNINDLSDREIQVFERIGSGFTSIEISVQLNVSLSTVDSYRARIKKKLGISNSIELHQMAGDWVFKSNS